MRLTADLISKSEIRINCIGDRELLLRGNKIPAVENLGACNNQVDGIDLSDNEIKRLGNLPVLSPVLRRALGAGLAPPLPPRWRASKPLLCPAGGPPRPAGCALCRGRTQEDRRARPAFPHAPHAAL